MTEVHLPAEWKDWKIVEKVGEGASGIVYKARRDFQGKTFYSAVKIINVIPKERKFGAVAPDSSKETWRYYQDIMRSVTAEIELMDQLKGITNIVSIEDYCVEELKNKNGWLIYIRMEFLENLQQYASRKKLTENEVIQVGIDICTALEACEKVHILHRDIKQDNIFISSLGYFKLGDFGIARKFERMSDNYSSKGTPSYMAPEIFHGDKYGPSADLYSLGIVLYRLMNRGRDPFVDAQKQMIYYKDREQAFVKRMGGERLPRPFEASAGFAEIILRACMYRPEERYHSASEMKESLLRLKKRQTARPAEKVLRQSEPQNPALRSQGQKRKKAPARRKKHIPVWLVIFGVMVVCAVGTGIAGYFHGESRTAADRQAETASAETPSAAPAAETAEETPEGTTAAEIAEETKNSTEAAEYDADISGCATILFGDESDGGIAQKAVARKKLETLLLEQLSCDDETIEKIAESITLDDFELSSTKEIKKGTSVTLSFTGADRIEEEYDVRLYFEAVTKVYNGE